MLSAIEITCRELAQRFFDVRVSYLRARQAWCPRQADTVCGSIAELLDAIRELEVEPFPMRGDLLEWYDAMEKIR